MEITEDDDGVGDVGDPQELCVHCVKPVGLNANFCVHCRAPLNFIASTIPYLSVFAEGWILRAGVTEPKNKMTVAGIWLIFLPLMTQGYVLWLSYFVSWKYVSMAHWTHWYFLATAAGMMIIGVLAVLRCTKNYLTRENRKQFRDE